MKKIVLRKKKVNLKKLNLDKLTQEEQAVIYSKIEEGIEELKESSNAGFEDVLTKITGGK